MTSRYDNSGIVRNQSSHYKEFFKKRAVNFIRQYPTQILSSPTSEETLNLIPAERIWSTGDRFYKLAHEYYGDVKYWWVIAWYNQAPTESHLKTGDLVYIPLPLERAFEYYGV